MFKKIAPFIIISFVLTSCADTFDSVKRGLTGAKKKSTDEFLVEKKDPLVLPPDFENLPTPDERIATTEELSSFVPVETYDLIYSFGVIHHSPHPEKIISEIKKYMNKDSTLKIMLYATDSWKNYMIEAGHDQPEAQYGCPIANTYTNDEVRELLDGFDVTIEQYHIFPYQIEPYKRGEFVKQPWFEAMPDEIFEVLKKNLGWHLLITAKLL